MLKTLGQAAGGVFFPATCALCEAPLSGPGFGCEECRHQLNLLRAQPACPCCAASPGPMMSPDGHCGQCRSTTFRFDGTIRSGPYVGPMVELLQRYKFGGAEYLNDALASLMVSSFRTADWQNQVEAIVPVPTHWVRSLTRGFYPAASLARSVSRRLRIPCLPLIRRIRLGPHQIGLNWSERFENVKGAFAVDPKATVADGCVCVVDDVMTSGATLSETAKILKAAGARRVYNLVLARAGRQDATLGFV